MHNKFVNASGSLFIVAAPSGGGKTSLVRHIVNILPNLEISISHTTRLQRKNEQHGVDYFFINEKEFQEMIKEQQFIEYAQVFDHYYGTSIQQIEKRLNSGIDVLLDIDWQGARSLKQIFPDSVSVFVVPPSLAILEARLHARKREGSEIIAKRMTKAQEELSHYHEFDYLIVNESFDAALADLKSIIIAERLTMARQMKQQHKLLSILCTKR